MYRVGQRKLKHHYLLMAGIVLVVCGLLAGVVWLLTSRSTVTNPKTMVTNVGDGSGTLQQFDEGIFSFEAPSDWKLEAKNTDQYTYHSTLKGSDARTLNIYINTIPTDFSINRLLPVEVVSNQINPGVVSDDCRNFTGTQQSSGTANVLAKWQGINFICDLSHINRNAVGTGVVGGPVNTIKLTGNTSGEHALFFVYTDHTETPNYNIFYDMLQSFHLK